MKVNEIYTATRLDQIGTTGSAPRLDQAGVNPSSGENRIAGQEAGGSQSDQVKLSNAGREMQQYLEVARQVPDVRQERVQEIKKQFEDGTYRVDAQQLADALLSKGDRINFIT